MRERHMPMTEGITDPLKVRGGTWGSTARCGAAWGWRPGGTVCQAPGHGRGHHRLPRGGAGGGGTGMQYNAVQARAAVPLGACVCAVRLPRDRWHLCHRSKACPASRLFFPPVKAHFPPPLPLLPPAFWWLLQVLVDDALVAGWIREGLPSDPTSVQNGTILTNSERWSLMMDPQLQVGRGGAGAGRRLSCGSTRLKTVVCAWLCFLHVAYVRVCVRGWVGWGAPAVHTTVVPGQRSACRGLNPWQP